MAAPAVLVTGASGFVGNVVCPVLEAAGMRVRRVLRPRPGREVLAGAIVVDDIGPDTDWARALEGIDIVVHLAARAHVTREDPAVGRLPESEIVREQGYACVVPPADYGVLAQYRRLNVEGTDRLARTAAAAGVRRFVFMSSVKANGESTHAAPFRETDTPRPEDAYGVSKIEAEERLRSIAAKTGMEMVILRPPLIYGPGVKGNLAKLLRVVERGAPLPLGGIDNRRSLVGVANLAEAVRLALDHPAAAGETFLVCDGDDVSSPELVQLIARAMHRKACLIRVPAWMLRTAGRLTGRTGAVNRLLGSLQIDASRIRDRLGWRPVKPLAQGIEEMVRAYLVAGGRASD